MTDFTLVNHGSVVLLRPWSDEARAWVTDHLPADAPARGKSIAIEPRYVTPILDGIEADALTWEVL